MKLKLVIISILLFSLNQHLAAKDFKKPIEAFLNSKKSVFKKFELNANSFPILKKGSFINYNSTEDTITVIGVGDIMLGTNYPSRAYLPPNDGKDILTPVKPFLETADLTFGNLEGVLLSGKGTVKRCSNPQLCYAFKSPDHYVNILKDVGFDVLSLANNHSADFGAIGKTNTVKVLKDAGIHYAGLLKHPYSIFKKGGITYGFCAFAPNVSTVKINDYRKAVEIIKNLESQVDIVIVSFHGGGEGQAFRNVTRKREYYVGEDRGNPYEFARIVIDAGADIVFGHGPHVTRTVDLYKNRFIAYSLGNFATYGRFSLKGSKGVAPIVKVKVTETGTFLEASITSIKQINRGMPVPDSENSALKEIIALQKSNFPESELMISEQGIVKKKKAIKSL